MTRSIRSRVLIATMAILAAMAAAFPQRADASSRVAGRRPIVVRGFYGTPQVLIPFSLDFPQTNRNQAHRAARRLGRDECQLTESK